MSFKCGIVGLPNVGKSSLFNLLLKKQSAESANYPFCTIEPNVGKVSIKDERLDQLAKIANSENVIYNQLEVVDIAGLVKGASKGEGLGNQFLGNIREVNAILHVARCFEGDVIHVEGNVDPIRDIEIVETEMIISDIDSLNKQISKIKKLAGSGNKEAKAQLDLVSNALKILERGQSLWSDDSIDIQELLQYNLLTVKPVIYVCNVSEEKLASKCPNAEKVIEKYGSNNVVVISVQVEEEIAALESEEERQEFLSDLNLETSGFDTVIQAGNRILGLETFFTAGPKEARAWPMKKNCLAPQAAGVIHTDFEKGFIKADIISCDDYIENGGENACKEKGLMRTEGKDYVMKDGDVVHFKFNV